LPSAERIAGRARSGTTSEYRKVSPGCAHCYAETFAERFRGVPDHPYKQGFWAGWSLRAYAQHLAGRLFCLLDNGSDEELAQRGFDGPQIAAINGMVKDHMTEFSDAEYRRNVRDLGDDYLGTLPRRIATGDNDD
jgi:hypothetical protein